MTVSLKKLQRGAVLCAALLYQYFVFVDSSFAAAGGRPYTVEDLLNLEEIVSARISPNAHTAAIVKIRSNHIGEHFERYHLRGVDRADIWLLSAKGSKNLTNGVKSKSGWWAPLWSPSGDKIAVLSTETQKDITLHIIDVPTGENRRISDLGVNLDVNLDGRRLRLHGPPYQWLSNEELLVSFRKGGVPDDYFASGLNGLNASSFPRQKWADMANGKVSSASILSSRLDNRLDRDKRVGHFLAVVNIRTLQMRTLITGDIHKVSVSHNRRKIAVALAENSNSQVPSDSIEIPLGHGGFGLDALMTKRRVSIIDIPSGKITRLPGEINPIVYPSPEKQMQWSYDDQYLAILYKDGSSVRVDEKLAAKLAVFSIRTSQVEELPGPEYIDRFYWCHNSLLFRSGPELSQWKMYHRDQAKITELKRSVGEIIQAGQTFYGVSPESVTLVGSNCNQHVDDLATALGKLKSVLDETNLGFLTMESYSNDQLKILRSNGMQTTIDAPCNYSDVLAVANDGLGAFLQCSGESGDRIYYATKSGYRAILSFNEHIGHVSKPFIKIVHYNALDGQQLSAVLFLPSMPDKNKPLPMIVDIYPGRMVSASDAKYRLELFRNTWLNRMQYVSAGYAVLLPSLPWPKSGMEEGVNTIDTVENGVLPAIDKVVSLGYADMEQIGLRGHSHGGYAAYSLLTRTNIFKAAVVSDATSDLISDYLQSNPRNRSLNKNSEAQYAGFAEMESTSGAGLIGGVLWDNYDYFVYNSPIRWLPHVTTPILILHGERDGIPLGQAEEYFYGLTRLGKVAQLVTYWGEAHNLKSPANIKDAWHRTEQWFDEYLRPDSQEPD